MYILLCGYLCFYSKHGGNSLNAGMEKRIKASEYRFDEADGQHVSEEAKPTFKRMLTVDPTKRSITGEIRDCKWLAEMTSDGRIDITDHHDTENLNKIQLIFHDLVFIF